ncbi:phosphotransferase [Bacillus suaedaesalsae]|uniref:Phosphotransferase n=1 Tax=Bacillus suaedaesalsae TaxID=2810349 RepID=A0ABS2DMF9_9BACI|nr:phosphotransferase [Bacillus suaedaesalsae]MBM6619542.1 phosphotransferase [Bacillus suaedaesalsae]
MTTNTTILIKKNDKVLVVNSEIGYKLPVVEEGPLKQVNIGPLQKAASKLLGVKIAVGRQLWKEDSSYIYEAFLLQDGSDLTWEKVSTIHSFEQKDILNEWFTEKEIPSLRANWFQEDYYAKTYYWIQTELEKKGYVLTGEIEQVKATDFSLVQLIPTNKGNVYFKAVSQSAQYEPELSQYLDEAHPGKTTSILSIHSQNAWLLMNDIGGMPLRSVKDQEILEKAICDFAKFQIAEINNVPKLVELGVPKRDLALLKEQIASHLESMCDTGLGAEDKEKVMSCKQELMDMCDELAHILPLQSIDHGDLHSANIQVVAGKNVFLDWGDAIVTHPFFSTRVFWNSLYELTENDTDEEWQELVAYFRPIYLDAWSSFAPKETLERALGISDQLGCIQRALSYYLYFTPFAEDQSDFNKPSQWLLALLEEREFATGE